MDTKLVNVYLYTRYERFWHWFQGTVIILLLTTGFEVHGTFSLFGFQRAVVIHNYAGLTWLISFFFFIFWILTTGEWRQYIPTTQKMFSVVRYYAWGIFKGEPHPVPKRKDAKHNPLQRLTYLSVAAFLLPLQMLTGFLYWGYNQWAGWGLPAIDLGIMAILHTAVAFAILQFLVIHVYMTTTGHSIFAHIKAMITGWEAVDPEHKLEEWEKKSA